MVKCLSMKLTSYNNDATDNNIPSFLVSEWSLKPTDLVKVLR